MSEKDDRSEQWLNAMYSPDRIASERAERREETERQRMMQGPQAERARKAIYDSIRRETEEELIKYGGEMLMEYLPTMLAGRFDEDLPKAHADKMLSRIRNNEKGEWKNVD